MEEEPNRFQFEFSISEKSDIILENSFNRRGMYQLLLFHDHCDHGTNIRKDTNYPFREAWSTGMPAVNQQYNIHINPKVCINEPDLHVHRLPEELRDT